MPQCGRVGCVSDLAGSAAIMRMLDLRHLRARHRRSRARGAFRRSNAQKVPVQRTQLSPVVNPNGLGCRGHRSCGVHAWLAIIVLPNDGDTQERTNMRGLVLTTVTAIGIGLLGLSGASAVPANGIAG
jgi:hypothetical protein